MALQVTIRPLSPDRSDVQALQRILESAPSYAECVTGAAPGSADALSTFTALPEGKSYEDKFVFGIFVTADMVGCIDLIRGYPAPNVATIGLLLVAEPYQRSGVGRLAHEQLEQFIRGWSTCEVLRLGVVMTNADVMAFWRKLGYSDTAQRRPYNAGTIHSQIAIMEKSLRLTSGDGRPDG